MGLSRIRSIRMSASSRQVYRPGAAPLTHVCSGTLWPDGARYFSPLTSTQHVLVIRPSPIAETATAPDGLLTRNCRRLATTTSLVRWVRRPGTQILPTDSIELSRSRSHNHRCSLLHRPAGFLFMCITSTERKIRKTCIPICMRYAHISPGAGDIFAYDDIHICNDL